MNHWNVGGTNRTRSFRQVTIRIRRSTKTATHGRAIASVTT